MLKIAVTGPDGLIGSRIIELLQNNFYFIPLPFKKFDITKRDQVNQALENLSFDIFLHLAAYTNVAASETEREKTYQLNVEGTRNVFEAVNKKNKKFIYISTDFVFDGRNPPFYEDSVPNPLGYYAKTKYEAEKIVKDAAMIVRLSYPYRNKFAAKKDYVASIRTALEAGKKLRMTTDCFITPTFVDDIAYAFKHLSENYSSEIFHLVGSQSLSHNEAGHLIAKNFGLDDSLISPITFKEYFKDISLRPQYSIIKSKKNNFYKMASFEEGLKKLL